ncbi:MAG: hypothetical protein WCC95_18315 [Candidatus Sulfotelmatobacter sp.]
MKRQIRRLRLRQGDIVVVENYETCKRLQQATQSMDLPKGVTYVPIIVAPEGVRLVSLDKLKKMVARMEREQAPEAEKTFLGEQ